MVTKLNNVTRVKRPTGKFRWFVEHFTRHRRLQQEWVEEDSVYLDWMGPSPKFFWEDVPVVEEKDGKDGTD